MVSKVERVGEKTEAFENLEQDVFKALENQKRRDILRLIGEKKGVSFTEVLNASKITDSPTLSYHLRELAPFIRQKEGKYELTPMGRDAYNLLLKNSLLWQSRFVSEKTLRRNIWQFVVLDNRHCSRLLS